MGSLRALQGNPRPLGTDWKPRRTQHYLRQAPGRLVIQSHWCPSARWFRLECCIPVWDMTFICSYKCFSEDRIYIYSFSKTSKSSLSQKVLKYENSCFRLFWEKQKCLDIPKLKNHTSNTCFF